jgi:hypothetical protein
MEHHPCSECNRAGSCPIEIIMRPFEHDEKGLEKLDSELTQVVKDCGGRNFTLGMLLNFHTEPVSMIRMAIAVGYVLGKGYPTIKYKMSKLDLLKMVELMGSEPHIDAS